MSALDYVTTEHTAEVEVRLAEAEAVIGRDPAQAFRLAHEVLTLNSDLSLRIRVWLLMGSAEYQQGHTAEALVPLLQAHGALTSQKVIDIERLLGCDLMLGRTHRDLGQFSEASSYFEEALALAHETRSPLEAEALNLLAGVVAEQGEYAKALTYLEKALSIARHYKLRERQATILDYTGQINFFLGDYPSALEHLKGAYDLLQEVAPESRSAIANLINLGNLYQVMGDGEQALAFLAQAQSVSRAAADTTMEAAALNNLANVHSDNGRWQEAQDFFKQALDLSRRINNRAYEIDNLDGLGQVQGALGQFQEAIATHTETLQTAHEIGDPGGEVDALLNLGCDYLALGQAGQACVFLKEGLALAETLERLKSVFEAHDILSQALEAEGDLAGALFHQREFHRAEKAVFNREGEEKTR